MKIISLGREFSDPRVDNSKYESSSSLLDYDVAIIDPVRPLAQHISTHDSYSGHNIYNDYGSNRLQQVIRLRRAEMTAFIQANKYLVVFMRPDDIIYFYTGEHSYSGTGRNARRTNFVSDFHTKSIVPIPGYAPIGLGGKSIELIPNSPLANFWKQVNHLFGYSSYWPDAQGTPFIRVKGTNNIVGTVIPHKNGGKIIVLPELYHGIALNTHKAIREADEIFISSLVTLIQSWENAEGDSLLPEWTQRYTTQHERELISNTNELEKELVRVTAQVNEAKANLAEAEKYKLLISSSGKVLEAQVAEALSKLGFAVKAGVEGRDDLIAERGGKTAVVEVKGVGKSSAEKHAAQLEKWVSGFYEETSKQAKGILVVNAFKDLTLEQRLEAVFPDQMLSYCISREHCLISTTQILGMLQDIDENPEKADLLAESLFSTVGIYPEYSNFRDFLIFEDYNQKEAATSRPKKAKAEKKA